MLKALQQLRVSNWASLILCGSLFWACGPKPVALAPSESEASDLEQGQLSDPEQVQQSTRLIGRIPVGTVGPRLALGKSGRLAVWAEVETQRPMWESLLIPKEGGPAAAQHFDQLGSGLEDFQVLGLRDGQYLLVSRRNVSGRDVLEAHLLDEEGGLVETARTISEAQEILWSNAFSVDGGALITFATAGTEGATIYSFYYNSTGEFVAPLELQTAVVSWQVAQRGDNVFLATVSKGFTNRSVAITPLDLSARKQLPSTQVTKIEGGALDLELKIGKQSVFYAYSEAREFRERIMWGALRLSGEPLFSPRALTLPRGNQQLVALALDSRKDQLLVLWEESSLARQAEREILGSVVQGSQLSVPQFSFTTGIEDPLLPEIDFDGTRFQFIFELPSSFVSEQDIQSAEGGSSRIALATFDPITGRSTTRLPRLEQLDGALADMAWDLSCDSEQCEVLLAKSGVPSLVFAARVDGLPEINSQISSPNTWAQPQMKSVEVLQKIPNLSDLAAVSSPDGTLLSWVTDFDPSLPYRRPRKPAPDGRYAPERAHFESLYVPSQSAQSLSTAKKNSPQTDENLYQSVMHSYRARSTGGVSISEAGTRGTRAIAWAALDGRDPQLFLTLVNANGKKRAQKMLTHSSGEVSDVAVTRIAKGYLVVWLDGRDDTPLVYSLVVDENLKVIRREKPLTSYSENPTGLVLRRVGDGVLVVWSDSEGAGQQGYGDLFSLSLNGRTGELVSPAHRLFATTPHSHSPKLAARLYASQPAATLVWIESSLIENGLETSMIRRAEVDLAGRVVGAPDDFSFTSLVSNFALHCEARQYCDIVFPLVNGQKARLWAVSLNQNGASEPHPLFALSRPRIQLVSPTLMGSSLYYVDQVDSEHNLLMRLNLNRH